jgi:hypothetical protein
MPAQNVLVETPVAEATRKAVNAVRVFSGNASPPIWTKILSEGHTASSQLNHKDSDDLHFLPSRIKLRNRLVAAALIASAVLVPYLGVKGSVSYHRWHAERQAVEMRVKAEADAKRSQEAAAAQAAAQKLIENQRRELGEKAPAILAAFVDKGLGDTNLPATPSKSLFTTESLTMWSDMYWGIDRGSAPDFVQPLKAAGAWVKPVQYTTIMPHTILVTAVVDVDGARKVWVGVMQDGSGRGSGAPGVINSVTNIPGVDAEKLYVAPEYARLSFSQVRDAFTTALSN